MSTAPKKNNYLADGWLVILLALLYGGGLAAVQVSLGGRIAENRKNETYHVIPELVPGAVEAKTEEHTVTGSNGKTIKIYKAIDASGQHIGWVLPGGGQGFADRIDILAGVNADAGQITGLYVLGQKETPGLGDYITGSDFRSQYAGKPTDQPLAVVKTDPTAPNEIRALTGATISSESVSAIVNDTIANLKDVINENASTTAPVPDQI